MLLEGMSVIQFSISPKDIIGIVVIILVILFAWEIIKSSMSKKESQNSNDSGEEHQNDYIERLILVLEGLPLIIYPFVLLANVMQLASLGSGNLNAISIAFMILFLVLSTAYPITYFLCFWFVFKRESKFKLWISLIPGFHILLTILLFNFNLLLEQKFSG